MWVNEGIPTMSFVLYTLTSMWKCDASYIKWKYRQKSRYHVIFARKYKKTFQQINIPGAKLNSNGTQLFKKNR